MQKAKRKLILILASLMVLTTFTGCKKKEKSEESAKLPIEQQEVKPLLENQNKDYISPEELAKLKEDPKFNHLDEKDLAYANVLKQAYGKNLLYQKAFDKDNKEVLIGTLVKNREKPTALIFTRAGCPYCIEMLKTFDTYKGEDFNLILAQGHVSEKTDINEDLLALSEEGKALGPQIAKIVEENSVFGTDPIMDQVACEYYPTVLYLDSQGYIINVSKGTDPSTISAIFSKTLEKPEENSEKK